MPDRLPRELRALCEFAQAVSTGTHDADDVADRVCGKIRDLYGFERVWFAEGDDPIACRAIAAGRAVTEGSRTTVPLFVDGQPLDCLVAEGTTPTEDELELLTALGLLAGVFVEKAQRDGELERAVADLRRLDRVKSEFIAIAAHELRTPAAVIHGITATLHLRGSELAPDQVDELRTALFEHSARLRDLVDQLLDLSRVESAGIRVHGRRFSPRERIDALLPRVVPGRVGDVRVDVPSELDIETDLDAFERVVGNLVSNACRYGRPPVLIRCRKGDGFCLVVEDRGDGVPPEFVPDLFGRFTRSETSRRQNRLGAGLGLSIARSSAETIGGTLHYEPAEPHGARFVLELPEGLPLGDRELDQERRSAPAV